MKQRFSTRTRLVSALLTLAMVFTFLPFSAFAEEELTDNYGIIPLAEYVLPDKAFREYLKEFDTNGDEILAPAERYAVTEIHAGDKNISNLYGIQFFPNLKMLYCYNNQLTKLDVSKNTALVYLDCSQNQLTELDVRQNAALWGLFCEGNQLSSLDVSNNTALDRLDCHLNNLTSLDLRYNTKLTQLGCNSNNLTSLDVSQNPELWLLNCSINQLTELDVSKNTNLKSLYCSDNQLTELDLSRNNKIFELEANNNYLTSLNVNNTSINIDNSSSKFFALGNTYPITVGSDRTFDLSTLPGTFDVTKATRWNGGTVRGNTLTVDAGATKVTYLYNCGKRSSYTFTLNVTVVPEGSIAIDASNFPDPNFRAYVKEKLDTDNNNCLSESERNAVTKIDVDDGYNGQKLTSLKGIEFFPNLQELHCFENQIISLDASKNIALQKLSCSHNQLTSLDVSKNTKLQNLFCYKNQLTELDVSQNKALTYLNCSENQLTSLDVSENIALQKLSCYRNQLTSLDVSQNAQLKELRCYGNQLTSLDVSKNPALVWLSCTRNQLTSLDLSQNHALENLQVMENCLTSLDLSPTVVSTLYAAGNQIDINVEETPRTFNLSTLPGKFDVTKASNWVGGTVSGNTLTVDKNATQVTYTYDCGKGLSRDFTLNVKVVPDGTVPPPEPPVTPPEPPVTPPSGGGDGGGAVVIVAAAGAVAAGVVGYGVYNYVSGRKLQALLPEGVAAPENRAQTALLLWNTAGRPEPAEAPAFADVADPDTAKAAQWCVEQGLMKRRLNGKFAPGSSIPAYQVLNAYRKLAG
ncbi:leucine-rich repeat domain-containing protein [Faecalibacterium prausnitzii]|uniref:leucine-rich repeat domain-containing protein n=1 Tax=Faecalibacterium prausnitzii TaxID=853 RepID=UPI001F2AA813|nr:leucine-rich repeat domain-containing protein [Faecalibacterium prausnitzii]